MLEAKVLGFAVTLAVAQWTHAAVAVPGEEYLGDPESDASVQRSRAAPRDDAGARGSTKTTPPTLTVLNLDRTGADPWPLARMTGLTALRATGLRILDGDAAAGRSP